MGKIVETLNGVMRKAPTWPFYVLALGYGAFVFWQAVGGQLGADPIRALEHRYGLLALQLLIAALCVTPLRKLFGLNLLKFRRMLGLMAFAFALAHVLVWLVLDRQADWARILADLSKRPYIIIGFLGFVMLIPLALTSTNAMIRRLGPIRWRRLHRLAYPATALGAIHYIWLVKSWPMQPMVYGGIVFALLAYRALPPMQGLKTRFVTG